jgi:hypothetical protein
MDIGKARVEAFRAWLRGMNRNYRAENAFAADCCPDAEFALTDFDRHYAVGFLAGCEYEAESASENASQPVQAMCQECIKEFRKRITEEMTQADKSANAIGQLQGAWYKGERRGYQQSLRIFEALLVTCPVEAPGYPEGSLIQVSGAGPFAQFPCTAEGELEAKGFAWNLLIQGAPVEVRILTPPCQTTK